MGNPTVIIFLFVCLSPDKSELQETQQVNLGRQSKNVCELSSSNLMTKISPSTIKKGHLTNCPVNEQFSQVRRTQADENHAENKLTAG